MAAAMNERVRIDASQSVGVDTVKAVVGQLMSGLEMSSSAVQAVVPRGLLEEGVLPSSLASLVSSVQHKATARLPSTTNRHRSARVAIGSRWQGMAAEQVREQIAATVTNNVQELLGGDGHQGSLEAAAPLMELGLDSLAATQLVQGLSSELELELPPTLLFDHPTIDALVAHLMTLVSNDETASRPPERAYANAPANRSPQDDGAAVLGIGGRLPAGLEGAARIWDAIQSGACAVDKVPFSRWDVDAVVAAESRLSNETKQRMQWGGFMEE
eukprot:SAG31_NODE_13755_length_849_cov_1.045333_1_plen_271_part_01